MRIVFIMMRNGMATTGKYSRNGNMMVHDIDSVMHYAAHICSHNSQPVLVDKKTGQPVQPGKQKTNSLSGR